MSSLISITTEQDRFDLAVRLGAIKVEAMTSAQLDLATALIFATGQDELQVREDRLQAEDWKNIELEHPLRVEQAPDFANVELLVEGSWVRFSPTSDWDAYGLLMEHTGVVQGTHESTDSAQPSRRAYWYSAHAYFSGTRSEGFDLREVVGQCVARLLEHQVRLQKTISKKPL